MSIVNFNEERGYEIRKGCFRDYAFSYGSPGFFFLLRNAEAGPRGGGAVEGPRGNVAIGTRFNVLPGAVKVQIINDRTYYVYDGGGYYVYYLPCEDDETVYCVVTPPE